MNPENDLVICARTKERLEQLKTEHSIEGIQIDLADIDKIDDFIEQAAEKMGGITILILNAAVPGIREQDEYTFKVDRDAQKRLVESAAGMLRSSDGRIVFLSSPQAENPIQGNQAYGQSKKEIERWLSEFSSLEENKNIKIFSINPGPVNTRMHDEAITFGGDEIKNRSLQIKAEGGLRDPQLVGRIISKMSILGTKFNSQTNQYDVPISNNELVVISKENIEFEKRNNITASTA